MGRADLRPGLPGLVSGPLGPGLVQSGTAMIAFGGVKE